MDYSREIYDCRDQIESDYWNERQDLPEPCELEETTDEEES